MQPLGTPSPEPNTVTLPLQNTVFRIHSVCSVTLTRQAQGKVSHIHGLRAHSTHPWGTPPTLKALKFLERSFAEHSALSGTKYPRSGRSDFGSSTFPGNGLYPKLHKGDRPWGKRLQGHYLENRGAKTGYSTLVAASQEVKHFYYLAVQQ